MNLLPFNIRCRQIVVARLQVWCAVWCACALLAAGWCWIAMRPLASQRTELAQVEEQALPVYQMLTENGRIEQRLREITQRESIVHELATGETPLSFIELISKGAAATDSRLQVQQLTLSHVAPREPVGGSAPASTAPSTTTVTLRLNVTGIAADDLSVAKFVDTIRSAGVFRSVELKSSRGIVVASQPARQYELECTR